MPATIKLKHDLPFDIATGRSRKETSWKNKEITWSELLNRIAETHYTAETMAEYAASSKARQDEIKDIGGFVGGYINGGRRKPQNIIHRQLISLDIDFAKSDIWEEFCLAYRCAAAIYSTHKHKTESPRLRLLVLLDRPVTTDEYNALSRRIAGDIDINAFDDTTFQPSRLMYWPSTSKDGQYFFKYQDGAPLKADEVLSTYRNWEDSSEWPFSDRVGEVIHRDIKKQGDPTEKPGLIGAFCRSYDIHEAIDEFLPEVYSSCDVEDRYTYLAGSTGAGLVIYDDARYCYSHHGTDPTSGKLCNAFDLVRLHLFGLKDEDAKPNTASNHLPSYLAMTEFIAKDAKVRKMIGIERLESSRADFAQAEDAEPIEDDNLDWMEELDADKKGNYRNTIDNMLLVLANDSALKGKFAFDSFEQREITRGNLPWRKVTPDKRYITDADDAAIRHYFEKAYNLTGAQRVRDALDITFQRNTFHPVRDYLNALKWDGVKRVETLFIDYLGAEDCIYTRTVTRKSLSAAVARVFNPGCKFDYILVTIGAEGIGKSTIISKLGRRWFSDTFTSVQGKEAFEQIQGVWIMEIAELAGLKKAEVEQTKHFISKTEDRFRVAYGRRIENFPRQVVFFGSTNNWDFLRDPTGNRRYWPVPTFINKPTKDFSDDLTEAEIGQIWAEAVQMYLAGEKLYLTKEVEALARAKQKEHRETDDRTGPVIKYLETPLPVDWYYMDLNDRRRYLSDPLSAKGTVTRDKVCIAEVWCELFGKPLSEMSRFNTKDLHTILRTIDGWEESKKGPGRFDFYGMQRYYSRKNAFSLDNLIYTSDGISNLDS